MCKIYVFLFLFILNFSDLVAQDAIFVSPKGNDHFSGSKESPLRTIDSALVLSRKQKIHTIYLRKGTYYNVSLKITKEDRYLTICGYRDELAVVFGGVPFTVFEKRGKLLVISLPQHSPTNDFQMILVNGGLRKRSRLPDSGNYHYANNWNVKLLPISIGGYERKPTHEDLSLLKYIPADILKWKSETRNAEISLFNQWSESYAGIESIDSLNSIIKLSYPLTTPPGSYGHKDYVVWNTREGLTQTGQWYWDKSTNKIYYYLLPGETVREIIVPSQRNIIRLEKGAENIRLKNFSLSAAANKLQNENFACTGIDPAIEGSQVRKIFLEGLSIFQTNGSALRLQGDDIILKALRIRDCGGGGIYINGKRITVDHCIIDSMGLIFKGATGIQGNVKNVMITNCKISNTPYSGICLAIDSGCVKNCVVKSVMTDLLDGGAIYGNSHHASIEHNYIVGNDDGRFTMGIYFDEQSSDCTAQDNVVVNCGIPIHCNIARYVVCQNNLFVDKGTQNINAGGSKSIELNGNVFIATKIQFNGPSIYDKQVDTLNIDPRLRRDANPTGITMFKNNCLFSMVSNQAKLPRTDKSSLSGTSVEYIGTNDMGNTILNLLNNKSVVNCIDNSKLGLTRNRLKDIKMLVQ